MSEAPLLVVTALQSFYGDFQALYGVDIEVGRGRIVAVIGANGAGKSTLLNTLVGLNDAPRESIRFEGEAIGGLPPYKIVRRGLALVPLGRLLFSSLSD
jgi:branched-chain amino acid transport system ATP-binding protein